MYNKLDIFLLTLKYSQVEIVFDNGAKDKSGQGPVLFLVP